MTLNKPNDQSITGELIVDAALQNNHSAVKPDSYFIFYILRSSLRLCCCAFKNIS